jgi:hypothetical protein
MAGGSCDLLLIVDIPIEAKVIYPEDMRDAPVSLGRSQVSQYEARSGIAFLAVLDMSSRTNATDLDQIANDVRPHEVRQKDGPTQVRLVPVQHVVGHGRPSNATD